jgi:hypothetical protein
LGRVLEAFLGSVVDSISFTSEIMFVLVLFKPQVFTPEEGHENADFKFALILEETRFRSVRNCCSRAIHSFAHIVSQNMPTFPFLAARSLMTSVSSHRLVVFHSDATTTMQAVVTHTDSLDADDDHQNCMPRLSSPSIIFLLAALNSVVLLWINVLLLDVFTPW